MADQDLTGGVNASIPLQAGRGVEQPNPLKQIGEFAGIQNSLNQAKLFPGALELQGQVVRAGAVNTQKTLNQAVYQAMLPLERDPDLSLGKVTAHLASIEHNLGYPTGGILPDIIAATTNGDPATAMQRVRTLIASRAMVSPENAYAQSVGTPVDQETGQGINSGVRAPMHAGGGVSVGSVTPTVPSVAALSTPVHYTGEGGQEVQTTLGEYALRRGVPPASLGPMVAGSQVPGLNEPPLPPAAPSSPPGQRPGRAQPYTGRYPAPAANLTTTSGPAPGTTEAGQGSAGQYVGDRRAAGSFATRVLPLKQAIGLLDETNTGPGSETLNHVRSFVISLANQGMLPKDITPNAVNQANFDELKKYMANYITGMPFAGGSDARMAEAISGNPNTQMSTLANKDLARVVVGMERHKSAQVLAFDQAAQRGDFGKAAQSDPNAAANRYAGFATRFNQDTDPRAFAYDLMSTAERGKMLAKMKPDERAKFQASLKAAYGLPGIMQ